MQARIICVNIHTASVCTSIHTVIYKYMYIYIFMYTCMCVILAGIVRDVSEQDVCVVCGGLGAESLSNDVRHVALFRKLGTPGPQKKQAIQATLGFIAAFSGIEGDEASGSACWGWLLADSLIDQHGSSSSLAGPLLLLPCRGPAHFRLR